MGFAMDILEKWIFKGEVKNHIFWKRLKCYILVTGFNSITSDDEISPDIMISQVDKYFYQAKQEGKIRVAEGRF